MGGGVKFIFNTLRTQDKIIVVSVLYLRQTLIFFGLQKVSFFNTVNKILTEVLFYFLTEEVLFDANFTVRISRYEDSVEITGSRSVWTEVPEESNKNILLQQLSNAKPCFSIQRYLPVTKAPSLKHELKSVISYAGDLNSAKMMEPVKNVTETNNNHENLGYQPDDDDVKPNQKPDDVTLDIEADDEIVASSPKSDIDNDSGEVCITVEDEKKNGGIEPPRKETERKQSIAVQ